MDFLRLFAVILGVAIGLVIILGISWPFTGILIRYYAHYSPKHVTLGDEGRGERGVLSFGLSEETESFNSYWGLLKRIKRVEGIRGYWKGIGVISMCALVTCLFLTVLSPILIFTPLRILHSPSALTSIFFIIFYILFIFFRIIIIRSVTTSRQIRVFRPRLAFKALLFNPFERQNPLRLYLLPGITFGIILSDVLRVIISKLKELIVDAFRLQLSLSPVRILLSLGLNICVALLLTPLDVITTRLAIQEVHPPDPLTTAAVVPSGIDNYPGEAQEAPVLSAEANTPPAYLESEEEGIEFAGAEEDVINLRTGQDPYRGIFHCAKSIFKEEGMKTFRRGWFVLAIMLTCNELLGVVSVLVNRRL